MGYGRRFTNWPLLIGLKLSVLVFLFLCISDINSGTRPWNLTSVFYLRKGQKACVSTLRNLGARKTSLPFPCCILGTQNGLKILRKIMRIKVLLYFLAFGTYSQNSVLFRIVEWLKPSQLQPFEWIWCRSIQFSFSVIGRQHFYLNILVSQNKSA